MGFCRHIQYEYHSHHLLSHLSFPSLNFTQIKQDAIAAPVVLVALYLLITLVAEMPAARCADHVVAALTALNSHATGWTLLAIFLHEHTAARQCGFYNMLLSQCQLNAHVIHILLHM